jgi:hypothetical protein
MWKRLKLNTYTQFIVVLFIFGLRMTSTLQLQYFKSHTPKVVLVSNVLAQTSAKVEMSCRFLTLVGSLYLEEQKLWLQNQVVHDPDTWTASHLLHLKIEYDVLVNKHRCIIKELYTVQDPVVQTSPSECLLLPPLHCLHKTNVWNQESPQPGDTRTVLSSSQRVLSRQMMRNWEPWNTNIKYSRP